MPEKDSDRPKAARRFAERWKGKGDEKSDTQTFWNELLQDICGVERPGEVIEYEKRVELEHKSFIDAYIPSTRVIIEQKSIDVALDKAAKQSDGTLKTPFEQAKRYSDWLPYEERARWIVVCNFAEFRIHDMEHPKAAPEIIKLEELPREWRKVQFLADSTSAAPKEIRETALSVQAGELVGKLYNALKKRYLDPSGAASLRSLNILCVRIVFLLYAEDAGLFPKSAFHDYLNSHRENARRALIDLFAALNQRPEERDPYETAFNVFPYVNGGLFEEKDIEIPQLGGLPSGAQAGGACSPELHSKDSEPLDIILRDMSEGFDWSGISPTIFGAVFESTLNPETRQSGGMHYTSIENIHRVIDPLFLDGLKLTLKSILDLPPGSGRTQRLRSFQKRLASLTFFDPACGSGNFLTETYLSLRRLENVIIGELAHGQISFAFSKDESPIQISIGQFYGIEINDFAVSVARTALWIAEAQMMKETMAIVQVYEDILPLKSYNHIIEGNALTLDWRGVIEKPDYIMGNPPFAGRRYRTPEQIAEVAKYFEYKDIDYVACWYKKAADFIQGTEIRCAFVSTNSITQGEQVPALWKDIGVHIDFAWRTFVWNSEATDKASVYCVIIGFSCGEAPAHGILYEAKEDGGVEMTNAKHINAYLMDAPDVYITLRGKPLADVPPMRNGNVPLDGDALKVEAGDIGLFADCPHLIKHLIGGRELLHNEPRYVLWLVSASPSEIKKYPNVYRRVEQCRANRLAMKDKGTRSLAETPTTFRDTLNPDNYVALPMVSSERRNYIPMAYFHGDTIPTNQVQIIPNATLYHFGVLESSVHMAWMRTVCGRLKSDYRYSKDIVYNNFPWPAPTDEQRAKIEQTAQGILDARAQYPDSSLADLYDETLMPPELRKAHKANDAAVVAAYGFEKNLAEPEIVARLMGMYERLTH